MPQEESKEDPKESWGEYTALFDSAAHIKGLSREVAMELHSPLHVGVEGLNYVQFWGTANLMESLEEAISADKVKGLSEINECNVQGICCSLHFSWS